VCEYYTTDLDTQIIHLLVLTTSSENLLILAGLMWSNVIRDFKEAGHFQANFRLNRLKDYVSRQYLWTGRYANGHATTLLLEVSHKETL